MTEEPKTTNNISTVRQALLDTITDLRRADNPMEIDRARAISEVAQTVINSAKVEVEYLKVTGQFNAPFLDKPTEPPAITTTEGQLPPGIKSITRHRLQG